MNGAYYYHGDHLGSAQVVTNHAGAIYERFEYTPYGEVWIEWANSGVVHNEMLPFRFTGKELDEETGLYYYGARYLDPRVSRWLSADPAMGDYIPEAPADEEARRRNGNLPGMGGIYNYVNLHAYHYAGNNPVRYIDPDGRELEITGTERNISDLIRQFENASGLKLDIAEGKVRITDNEKATGEVASLLRQAIEHNKTITLNAVSDRGGIFFDVFDDIGKATIDVSDFDIANDAYPGKSVGDSLLAHVLGEQIYSVTNNADYITSHENGGVTAEKRYWGGNTRIFSGTAADSKYWAARTPHGNFGFYQDPIKRGQPSLIPANRPFWKQH
jgi:RHS repeat-associated protein